MISTLERAAQEALKTKKLSLVEAISNSDEAQIAIINLAKRAAINDYFDAGGPGLVALGFIDKRARQYLTAWGLDTRAIRSAYERAGRTQSVPYQFPHLTGDPATDAMLLTQ